MESSPVENARSILGTLALETSMSHVALRGVKKGGSAAFEQAVRRIALLTRQLEEIAGQMEAAEQQLHLGIEESVPLRLMDSTNNEHDHI